ncbi:MAG TPA: sarcosine oxidase subunit delta [Sphingorhabdus lacus]|jgi:heterotetrameric sarcosine oxidase delta subunit|uniref:Sarcosine oxidase subunit delta n=1 Tax=Sphingorhabdus lacus TaxID=392610 RepID=A0A6I6L202_9SPHN|nr:sarcosine oxidase subunit delta [Sphingorhabdus lacus]QGY79535.1 sarcosine oxidase subunit delta [Sphingorhabdus lacus]HNW17477.1 sarcosine oxidase subunit delta [Sphingorhabdus lacus]HPV69138.1 sarcosine oxidase subunit delta [Sphingorhabdus lacus]
MMQIICPHCGPRAQTEFVYERTVDSVAPVSACNEEAMQTLFTRGNPRGVDDEIWRHTFGCRAWMVVTRHRVTNEISNIRAVGPEALP